jgi:hypothetical protein
VLVLGRQDAFAVSQGYVRDENASLDAARRDMQNTGDNHAAKAVGMGKTLNDRRKSAFDASAYLDGEMSLEEGVGGGAPMSDGELEAVHNAERERLTAEREATKTERREQRRGESSSASALAGAVVDAAKVSAESQALLIAGVSRYMNSMAQAQEGQMASKDADLYMKYRQIRRVCQEDNRPVPPKVAKWLAKYEADDEEEDEAGHEA